MSEVLVREWYLRFDAMAESDAAVERWHAGVRDREWSPVGEPSVIHDGMTPVVVGKVVQHPGLIVEDVGQQAIRIP